jgi:dTDP-4-dehydrorhamnose 3,5-epimerase
MQDLESLPETIEGCKVISGLDHQDDRGSFIRIADEKWLPSGLSFKQFSGATNLKKYTFRGLHFEKSLKSEYKLIRIINGTVLDVLIDIRPDSPTYLNHSKFIMDSRKPNSILIPPGVAHGYLTLEPNTTIVYGMTEEFSLLNYGGIRFNDPAFGIVLPKNPDLVSKQDLSWPNWKNN